MRGGGWKNENNTSSSVQHNLLPCNLKLEKTEIDINKIIFSLFSVLVFTPVLNKLDAKGLN